MKPLVAILFVVGLPTLAMLAVIVRIAVKRRRRDALVDRLLRGFERLPHDCFRVAGRVFRLQADLNPLFSSAFSLRLSTFVDKALECEIREARNVPTQTPQRLRDDPFYGRFVLDAPSPDEAAEHLLAVKDILKLLVPERWKAYSRFHCEIALSANTEMHASLAPDMAVLASLAVSPGERRPRGGTWTIREGFEERVPLWHWKPEQRARLPEGTRRWCVSAWYDNAYLNLPLARFFWRLGAGTVVTMEDDLWFLEHGFGRRLRVEDHLVSLTPEMAVAGDQWLDGELFQGYLAGAPPEALRGAIKLQFHDRAVSALAAGASVYVRRLWDDEFSWFSGEYEIVSAALSDDAVRSAFDALAEECGAQVKRIERPFSFKLLKEDRLDLSF